MTEYAFERRLGATPLRNGRTEFRVWAPNPGEVRLRLGGADHPLEDAGYGIYEATVDAGTGDDYEFVLDGTRCPTRARVGSRRAYEARRGSSIRRALTGRTAISGFPASRTP